jgi:predicted AlkP superfamily phosphohydrolase/phosphomutase
MDEPGTTPPLVVFALDSADPGLLERWTADGYLPNLHSLMQGGCWGKITGPELVSEQGIWLSLWSGVSRAQHGYYYWRPMKPGTYSLELSDLRDLPAPPFWCALQGQDQAAIIDAPEIYPRGGVQGVQVANWGPHNPRFETLTQPPELLEDLQRRFGLPRWFEEKVESNLAHDRQIYRGLLEQIEKKGALCRHLVSQGRFRLIVAGFFEVHIAGHQFWRYTPDVQASGAAMPESGLSDALRSIYQAMDREIGLLLEQVPPTANVFVVSNTGIQEDYPSRRLTEDFCRQLGYQVAAAPAPLSPDPLILARRVLPEAWRSALGRRLPRKTREGLLSDGFRSSTNWRETRAFAIPSFYTGFLRVNLRGREPEGTVEPGAEYEHLLDQLEADLAQLVDPVTGAPAVKQVARTVDLFGGDPPLTLPDLFVEWTPTPYLKRRVEHPKAVLTQENLDFTRGSHHTHHGFLAAAGPGIRRGGRIADLPALDLAPTFFSLLDHPVPGSLTGQVARAITG